MWRRITAISIAVLTPFAATACGSGSASAAPGKTGSSQQADGDAANPAGSDNGRFGGGGFGQSEKLQKCLADNGLDFEMPTGDTDPDNRPAIDQDSMRKIQETCGDLMQRGDGAGGFGGGMDLEAIRAWTECLADNGVEMESPNGGTGWSGPGGNGVPSDGERTERPTDGEMPDPPVDGSRPGDRAPFGLDTSDPTVASPLDACQDLQPQLEGRPGSSDGTAPA